MAEAWGTSAAWLTKGMAASWDVCKQGCSQGRPEAICPNGTGLGGLRLPQVA